VTIEAGQALFHDRVIEKIGEGGMGVVRKAEVATSRTRSASLPITHCTLGAGQYRREPEGSLRLSDEIMKRGSWLFAAYSSTQVDEQPSPESVLPSSHCSAGSTVRLPHPP